MKRDTQIKVEQAEYRLQAATGRSATALLSLPLSLSISLPMTLPLLLAFAFSSAALARHDSAGGEYRYARVLSVQPVVERLAYREPETRCWQEHSPYNSHHARHHSRRNDPTSTIVGGILGAAIGNAVGHGRSNRRLGAAAGGLLGAAIGHDMGRHGGSVHGSRRVQRCETTQHHYESEHLVGYDVKYRYHDQVYTSRMDHDPGQRVKIRVQVEPAYQGEHQ